MGSIGLIYRIIEGKKAKGGEEGKIHYERGPQTAPETRRQAPNGAKMTPKGPKLAQEHPKTVPRQAQDCLGPTQDPPRPHPDHPKTRPGADFLESVRSQGAICETKSAPKRSRKRSQNEAKIQDEQKVIQTDLGPVLGRSGAIWGRHLG